ncbi:MAG: ABC transporter permease [Acidipropionibacterium acidipropionici]|jgi:ABC-2 type transport system permease protein|uniref:ABC-2 type transporter n=1 Tax=Acidipropionibacterium acidipropionici (strain ATCC 4875 / DSM 20272 / JCM 6432 / NBRC 12425 / NCIMB 8070 / 4) TaxID=1171373 RepID=K7RUR3_ACIA4|nr:ABC transporter permease [Acidipropionibacterium acidipropionici]AFV88708.1 ABC-2 type transporter [Acidipropionibacterium acidipropionici ATCC 4875]ALN13981.1 permease [Acidipropionibacterium acidipropionici]APZ10253.1 permease [Acidipropionibacterium acidipropionici]
MTLTYTLLDVRRMVRNPGILIFAVAMPAAFYAMFGALQSYSDIAVFHGNVSAMIMTSIAAYGAVIAASSLGADAALEQDRGWGRQLAITPMTPARYLLTKVVAIQLVALMPVAAVFALAAVLGARIDGIGWLWAFLLCWLCCVPFTIFGLGMAQLIRTETAGAITSFCVIGFAFLGNMLVPLSGTMLTLSPYTPLFGINQLARYPVMGNWEVTGGEPVEFNIWVVVVNLGAWTALFTLGALLASRRGQER